MFRTLLSCWFLSLITSGPLFGGLANLIEEQQVVDEMDGHVTLMQLWETTDAEYIRRVYSMDTSTPQKAAFIEWGDYDPSLLQINLTSWGSWNPTRGFLEENGYTDYLPPESNRGQSAIVFLDDVALSTYADALSLFATKPELISGIVEIESSSGTAFMLSRFWMYESLNNGWRETPIGLLNDNSVPWLFSMLYGFLYEPPVTPDNAEYSVWSWSPTLGWLYIYPGDPSFIYKAEAMGWAWRNPADGVIWDL